jgi:N-acetyl-D-muramate 6-phosphate phosphatase
MPACMESRDRITAIVWDFDGTLADTHFQHLCITRDLLSSLTGRGASEFPPLRSLEAYQAAVRRAVNWRELYRTEFGLSDDLIDAAGRLWAGYHLRDDTPVQLFDGVREALAALDDLPHGIVSQSARGGILKRLAADGVQQCFRCVVGYEEVPMACQKPSPEGLILCIEELTGLAPGRVLYVGDHETDAATANNANEVFRLRGVPVRVVAVAAAFCNPAAGCPWPCDHIVWHPQDVVALRRSLSEAEAQEPL